MSLLKLGNGYKGIFHGGSLTFPLYLKVFLITWAYKLTDTGSPSLHNWTPLSPWNPIFSWKKVKVAQSCSTLFDPMDCSPPGSCFRGIRQTRILEWVVIPFSRGSSQPRDWTGVSCTADGFSYHLSHQGNPNIIHYKTRHASPVPMHHLCLFPPH